MSSQVIQRMFGRDLSWEAAPRSSASAGSRRRMKVPPEDGDTTPGGFVELLHDLRRLRVIELLELGLEELVPSRRDLSLPRAAPPRRPLAVPAVEGVHDLHALDNLAERREAHAVEVGVV